MSTTGKVREVAINLEYSWVVVEDDSAEFHKFILWSDPLQESSPNERVIQSMWVSLLRDALVHDTLVRIVTDSANPVLVRGVRYNPV